MIELESLVEKLHQKRPAHQYSLDGYIFVLQALDDTLEKLEKRRHLVAREFLEGAIQFAADEFGPMAATVLKYWGIQSAQDFGRIVFDLVDAKLLSKQPEDDIRDFDIDWDLESSLYSAARIQKSGPQ